MTRTRWIALGVLVAIGAGLLIAVLVMPWGQDSPAVQAPPLYHQGDDINVHDGDEFVVALASNPTTGYMWTAQHNPNVTFVSSHQTTASTLPGAPGTQELTFRADHTGSSTLELVYSRSFEPDQPPAKTAKFPVTVTSSAK
jgi:predicted secreted protein